ncbi:polysaccharide deacetylase family protein [Sphingosinicella terrae]|uniref:polysaccharide deacetylase family protein n=1 Tax=Sphingosinicella terrae TaxID=2172047 RepID=UPI000E0CDCD7|nr:polysaccharide deacetylase family protein [Sphingosinicella terrae]
MPARCCIPLLLLLLTLADAPAAAEPPSTFWPDGARAAIVLTYDDALPSQLDTAAPQLEASGFRGTFFLNATFPAEDVPRWRAAAAAGHELGNHSAFHPCPAASFPAERIFHAERWSVAAMLRDIAAMNTLLAAIDGEAARTYSVPCSQTIVGGEDYVEPLRASGLVRHVRTGGDGDGIVRDPAAIDRFRVPSRSFTELNGAEDLIAFAEAVRAGGGLGIFMFHGVGGDHLAVSAEAHQALLDWLAARRGEIWVAPFGEVIDHVAERAEGR